ncbi:MAG TPA: CHAT domain-containing protein [Blastocatellia bacterium]|nr:CHAT domain-containing protein [Blastocatellia bacterium]
MLTYIGDCFAAQNDLSSVVDYYKLAAEISERRPDILSQSFAHELLATVYRKLGDYAKAKASIQRGLDIARTGNIFELELTMMNGLGALHLKQNEIEQAIAIFSAAIQLAESKNSHREAWKARAGLAEAYKMSGRISQAHLQYQKAIEELENIRAQVMGDEEKGGFFHDKIKVYKDIVDVLMQLREKNEARHYEAEAFQYAERARARAFLELLVEGKIKLERDLAPDLLKRKQKIDAVISKLHSDLTKERLSEPANQNKATLERLEQERAQADADYADWLRELRQRDPQYARLKYPEPISLAQTQQLLDEQTVMLSYSLGETSSFLFVVSRDGFSPLWLNAPAQAVSREVEQILAAIKNRSMPEFRKLSVRLYERLIKPAESLLKGKRELVILADGALHRLPFEVLLPPSSRQITQPDARKLPYLVREHAISYAPSASVLAELQSYHKQAAPGQKVFLAFADPVYDAEAQGKDSVIALTTRSARGDDGQWKFNRLLYSKNEAEGIAKLFPDGQADIYQGAQATEENAKAPGRLEQYRILHFAAHGLINQSRPRFSGVVLTLPRNGSGGAEDGILQAYEIFNLKLNADLVVLSACETGLGKEVNGEGMMSLMRAFIYAGTPSVVASLWNVDDEKSAELMIRFYTHLKDGKHKSEALRQAQLDTIQKYGAPYFWAPFVLMGRAK